jgi:flagellar biogenesis protein FliO
MLLTDRDWLLIAALLFILVMFWVTMRKMPRPGPDRL